MTTTIDAENAKQIRRKMDVLIRVEPESGDPIVINNENLIRAILSLRSDLSIINPTLPESELNIEAYFDDDISSILAEIPDETPITYQAGYDSDLSPVRKFYLAEKITWENNVMSIHAVDSVHRLDGNPVANMLVGYVYDYQDPKAANAKPSLTGIYQTMVYVLETSGIEATDALKIMIDRSISGSDKNDIFVVLAENKKSIIATLMNLFHQDLPVDHVNRELSSFWPTFVDAGIPKLTAVKPTSKHDIFENDCGNVKTNTERKISKITVDGYQTQRSESFYGSIGSGEWLEDTGVFLSFKDEFITTYKVKYENYTIPHTFDGLPSSTIGQMGKTVYSDGTFPSCVYLLVRNDIQKGEIIGWSVAYADKELNTQIMPWNSNQESLWDLRVHDAENGAVSVSINEGTVNMQSITNEYGHAGFEEKIEMNLVRGKLLSQGYYAGGGTVEAYPAGAYNSLLNRSNVTGSFIWKGDPRMQPRDVFTFYRLDGTEEDCTIENITITHEKGGTSAEITYRKGIC